MNCRVVPLLFHFLFNSLSLEFRIKWSHCGLEERCFHVGPSLAWWKRPVLLVQGLLGAAPARSPRQHITRPAAGMTGDVVTRALAVDAGRPPLPLWLSPCSLIRVGSALLLEQKP